MKGECSVEGEVNFIDRGKMREFGKGRFDGEDWGKGRGKVMV